jgi:uncharacterized protein (DUF1810 family)
MWFVFPQLAGLGRSPTAQRYAISGAAEARAYLDHPLLGPRLLDCTRALLAVPATDPAEMLGTVDAQKLRSSMTLFASVDADRAEFRDVLEKYFDGSPDEATTSRL